LTPPRRTLPGWLGCCGASGRLENRLHWVRDVVFAEDHSRVRTAGGPQVMASLRNLVIGLLRLAGHAKIARALRWIARNPVRALALLGV
jgi:hypothetical protein